MVLEIELYLKDNIDDKIKVDKWNDVNNIPIFLRNIYKFYSMTILENPCILLEIIDDAPGVDSIKKHVNVIKKITNHQIVFYYKEITRYRRKSLIENNIAFVIGNGQIFLPFLGLHFKKTKSIDKYVEKKTKSFTPSAQVSYLYFFYNRDTVINITDFSEIFGWPLMTASRALNELYNAKLLTYKIGGKTSRSKEYSRISDMDYFENGRELLSSPVKRIVYVKAVPKDSYVAGLEALAEQSMINPPKHKIRAIHSKCLVSRDLEIIKNKDIVKDEKTVELQVWDYDPKLFTNNNLVDVVSLYASLREEKDERIEQALEEVLRGEKWYQD